MLKCTRQQESSPKQRQIFLNGENKNSDIDNTISIPSRMHTAADVHRNRFKLTHGSEERTIRGHPSVSAFGFFICRFAGRDQAPSQLNRAHPIHTVCKSGEPSDRRSETAQQSEVILRGRDNGTQET